MASRYWVGGTGTWDGASTTHWSATSGGSSGASVPGAADNVFLDGNAGSGTITTSGTRFCNAIDCTGFTQTLNVPSASNLFIAGNVTLGASMTFTGSAGSRFATAGSGTSYTFTSNGITVPIYLELSSADSLTFADNYVSTSSIGCQGAIGTINLNNKNVTCTTFCAADTGATTTLGSGTLTLTGADGGDQLGLTSYTFEVAGTVTASTGTIKLTDATSTAKTFSGNGKTYKNLWLSGAGSGAFTIAGSNTFADFKIDTPPHTVNFTAGTTQTVTTFTVNGAVGVFQTLQSTSGGSAWNLSCASGTVTATWVSLQDSHAAGGATFNATSSTNVSGNTGWTITAPAAQILFSHPLF